jgi:uncharacterized cupredoxin-like copper-binding protein
MKVKTLLIPAIGAAVLVAACTGNSEPQREVVEVKLLNWAIEPEVSSVEAGEVTFRAVHEAEDHSHGSGNEGGDIHELAVSRKGVDGSSEIIGTAANIAVGQQKDLTLKLKPGDYELQCNVVEMIDGKPIAHYPLGMHLPFKVS